MGRIEMAVNRNTPTVVAHENRGLGVREIAFYRHPDQLDDTQVRITRHHFAPSGLLKQSADPRLAEAGIANFIYHNDLRGNALHTRSVDAGTSVRLNDTADRLLLSVNGIQSSDSGPEDHSQAASHTWHYEDPTLPGRPLAVSEQVAGDVIRVVQRFVYATSDASYKDLNLAGLCIEHFDTAGLLATEGAALCGVPIAITRQLPSDADNPDMQTDWFGNDPSAWRTRLQLERHTTLTGTDSTGSVLTTQDAAGHRQRLAYDIASHLSRNWLTVSGATEQLIVTELAYSAAQQKLSETHANGVTCTYRHEPYTQRLIGIRAKRTSGLLQDLRYQFDPVGNVLNVGDQNQRPGTWRNQRAEPQSDYGYDSLYQLVWAAGREMANISRDIKSEPEKTRGLGSSDTYSNYLRTYFYDTASNLTQIRHSAPATNNSYTINISLSDRSNRGIIRTLATTPKEVDARFTTAGHQRELQPGQRLRWTPRGELQKVEPVTRNGAPSDHEFYLYDAHHQRIMKSSNQTTTHQQVIYLPELEIRTTSIKNKMTERLQITNLKKANNVHIRLLHWPTGKPTGIDSNSLRYHYTDLIGSCGFEVDGDGLIISMEEYYPYGGTSTWLARPGIEASYKTVRFSGKERDATGLYYFGHRYYYPLPGRWMSPDPAFTVDGLNLYAMVRNNPTSHVDDSGFMLRSPATVQAPTDNLTVSARGLANFSSQDSLKVLWALTAAESVLKSALAAPLNDELMMESFGPAYHERTDEITQAWKSARSFSEKYFFDGYLQSKLLRASGGNSRTLASVHSGDYPGSIRFHDSFFEEPTTEHSRTLTTIHELTHLGSIIGVSTIGASSDDFFYVGSKNNEISCKIAYRGVLDVTDIVQPKRFLEETAAHYRMSTLDSSKTELKYCFENTTQILPINTAAQWFSQDPSLRARMTSRNADSLAFAAMRMARKM